MDDMRLRLEKYFDAGSTSMKFRTSHRDFNFLVGISATAVNMIYVGDFYRHTYDTSEDGSVDVPPVLSNTAIWSPIPQLTEIGREEALFRRADHRLPA